MGALPGIRPCRKHKARRDSRALCTEDVLQTQRVARSASIFVLLIEDVAAQSVPFSSQRTILQSGCCGSVYQPVCTRAFFAAGGIDKWPVSDIDSSR